MELCLGLSVPDFWDKCMDDNSTLNEGVYFSHRGDLHYHMNKWRPPETPDEKEFKPEKGTNLPVKMVRDHKVEI